MDVVPFEGRFAEPAAALLAVDYAPAGEGGSTLDLSDVDVARRLVDAWQGTGPAVAAVDDDGMLIGFMAATLADCPGQQHSRIRIQQHASAQHGKREIYRGLYAALADRLTVLGGFEHTLAVSAAHSDVITCLFELGFGVDQVKGLRPTSSPIGAVRNVQLREAVAGDVEDLLKLAVELQQFHAGSQILRPALADLRSIKDGFQTALIEERRLLLVAEENAWYMPIWTPARAVSTASINSLSLKMTSRTATETPFSRKPMPRRSRHHPPFCTKRGEEDAHWGRGT